MKKYLFLIIASVLICSLSYAQIDIGGKIKRRANREANDQVDKGIDESFNQAGKGVKSVFTKKDKEEDTSEQETDETSSSSTDDTQSDEVSENDKSPELKWSKYDFVPGDKVIFEDNLINEENGEFPSRWDLERGNVEIANFDGSDVIMLRDGSPTIVPYIKDSDKDYLPEVFTVEFDAYISPYMLNVYFWDDKNQGNPSGNQERLQINYKEMTVFKSSSEYPASDLVQRRWVHVAIAYTKGKLKAYMDDTRLINIPRLDIDPSGISIHYYSASDENLMYIKNIRIAEGGVKYYDKVMQDGKIIANGIRFNVGKSTLKPESMGIINEIYDLMTEHPEIKFSVEGHTDSDGDDNSNQTLSEARAKTVADKLISMGIAKDRLTSKGWGETKPISDNTSSEGKANNRRVEFVKL